MNLNSSKATRTTTCLLLFLIPFFIVRFTNERKARSSTDYASIFPLAAAFLLLAIILILLAIRTTMVTWITVLVLLAFAGNRRRVLVKNGRKITLDVTMHLVMVVTKERGIAVVVCTTVATLLTIAWLRNKLM